MQNKVCFACNLLPPPLSINIKWPLIIHIVYFSSTHTWSSPLDLMVKLYTLAPARRYWTLWHKHSSLGIYLLLIGQGSSLMFNDSVAVIDMWWLTRVNFECPSLFSLQFERERWYNHNKSQTKSPSHRGEFFNLDSITWQVYCLWNTLFKRQVNVHLLLAKSVKEDRITNAAVITKRLTLDVSVTDTNRRAWTGLEIFYLLRQCVTVTSCPKILM